MQYAANQWSSASNDGRETNEEGKVVLWGTDLRQEGKQWAVTTSEVRRDYDCAKLHPAIVVRPRKISPIGSLQLVRSATHLRALERSAAADFSDPARRSLLQNV